jgi:CrcB protein
VSDWVAVFLGAGIGGVLRYAVALWVARRFSTHFPVATFLVNTTGCLLIGVATPLVAHREPARLLLVVGVLGGYTTFSTFGLETYRAIRDGMAGLALLYATGSVLAGLAAVWLGLWLARR